MCSTYRSGGGGRHCFVPFLNFDFFLPHFRRRLRTASTSRAQHSRPIFLRDNLRGLKFPVYAIKNFFLLQKDGIVVGEIRVSFLAEREAEGGRSLCSSFLLRPRRRRRRRRLRRRRRRKRRPLLHFLLLLRSQWISHSAPVDYCILHFPLPQEKRRRILFVYY